MTPGAVSQTIEWGSASRAAYMSVAMPSKAPARVLAEGQAAIDRDWLKLFVDYAQGDPRLTAWDEAFVASMRHCAYRTGRYADLDPGWRLSHKQLEVCHRIDDKLQIAELELPVGQEPDDALLLDQPEPVPPDKPAWSASVVSTRLR